MITVSLGFIATVPKEFVWTQNRQGLPAPRIKSKVSTRKFYFFLWSSLRCQSWNCLASGTCGESAAAPRHFATYVYVLVAIGIFGGQLELLSLWSEVKDFLLGLFGTLIGLFLLHRKQRDEEREKRIQYWREQVSIPQITDLSWPNHFASECIPSKFVANARDGTSIHTISARQYR